MTITDHLINYIGRELCLWKDGDLIADGPLEFDGMVFKVEKVAFDSGLVKILTETDIKI
jgi:hypothetical protein